MHTNVPLRHTVTLSCNQIKDCKYLAEAAYYEARGEGREGMLAVMSVIANRAKHQSRRWPNSIQGVVKQKCEFSYRCDGSMERKINKKEWKLAQKTAFEFLTNPGLHRDKVSLFYHKTDMKKIPKWARVHTKTKEIGRHTFFDCSTLHC